MHQDVATQTGIVQQPLQSGSERPPQYLKGV
jgi:hypothetical protein